jgi:hypothetical protein
MGINYIIHTFGVFSLMFLLAIAVPAATRTHPNDHRSVKSPDLQYHAIGSTKYCLSSFKQFCHAKRCTRGQCADQHYTQCALPWIDSGNLTFKETKNKKT